MLKNKLLSNIFYGSELPKLKDGTAALRELLRHSDSSFSSVDWTVIHTIVMDFFSSSLKGQSGGPITAGDGYFIAAYLAAIQPTCLIEVGISSGVSSAFILYAGERLGLLKTGKTFLHSVDLFDKHPNFGFEIGRVVELNFPQFLKYWRPHFGKPLPELARDGTNEYKEITSDVPTMAFIDGNHMHPWPLVDLVAASRLIQEGSWALLQDTQMMERWLANCVEQGVPCPPPCRGVNYISTLWPASKVIGTGMSYNMAAVRCELPESDLKKFVLDCLKYPPEAARKQYEQCCNYLTNFRMLD